MSAMVAILVNAVVAILVQRCPYAIVIHSDIDAQPLSHVTLRPILTLTRATTLM